jgi:lipopolysaccharide biosynthesis regulator YciM
MKNKSELSYYLSSNVKSLSQLKHVIVSQLTHGNVFRWHGEADSNVRIAQAKAQAEQLAMVMIERNLDSIPARIKRDL